MKENKRKLVLVMSYIAIVSLVSILLGSPFWYVPSLVGIVAIGGTFSEKKLFVSAGMFGTIYTFYIVNYMLPVNTLTISTGLGMFFLFFAFWSLTRRSYLVEGIENKAHSSGIPPSLVDYKKKSNEELIYAVILGFVVSFMGGFIAFYSSIGLDVTGGMRVPILVLLGAFVMVILYSMIVLVPRFR